MSSAVRRLTLERAGTFLMLLFTLAVLAMVGLSAVLSVAADDLHASVDEARGKTPQIVRSQPGRWLSAQLSGDLASNDLGARTRRADQLGYRSDRVREAAAVLALIGLLIAVLTASPATDTVRGSYAPRPANPPSSGTS